MTAPKRRFSTRGASLLAALVFVAILGGFTIAFQSANIAMNKQALVAAVDVSTLKPVTFMGNSLLTDSNGKFYDKEGNAVVIEDGKVIKTEDLEKEEKAKADARTQKCAIAVATAKTAATSKTAAKPTDPNTDDCIAAAPDPAKPGNFKCVGKSATVTVNADGTLKIKGVPNPNVSPGTCKTVACVDTSILPISTVKKCVPIEDAKGINKALVEGKLASDGITYRRTISNNWEPSCLTCINALSKSQLDVLNTAFGKNPADTTGAILVDSDGTLRKPDEEAIKKIAAYNPDPTANSASEAVNTSIADACKSTPTPAWCTDAVTIKPQYQGPCPNGQTMDPNTGACGSGVTPDCEKLKNCPGDTRKDPAPVRPCPTGTRGTYPNCVRDNTFPPDNLSPSTMGNPTRGGSGALSGIGSFLSGLAGAFKPQPPQPPAPTPQACRSDPNQYAQQQQEYQQALQQHNYQLQQYQYQQQMNQYNSQYYGQSPPVAPPPPAQPVPCTPSTGTQCQSQPQQPPASSCTSGGWRATYSGVCVTGWQCVPNPTATSTKVTASLSCQPKVADIGMSLAISYACSSGTASSNSFDITDQPAGSATKVVAAPPVGTNTATYTLTCTDEGKTAGAQCSVQVNRPNIILVANPKTVKTGETSLIGWLTSGMESCVISSSDQPDFTARNSSNTSVNGAATWSPVTANATFLLHCQTIAGGTKDATATVSIQ